MALRFTLAALTSVWLVGCAAAGSNGTAGGSLGDAGGASPEGSVSDDASGSTGPGSTGPTGPTGSTGPGVFDSGPPATIGGGSDAGDLDGSGAETGGGGCSTLAQCPYEDASNVSAVACSEAGACQITCNGENYDVNGTLTDGCEVAGQCVASQGSLVCPVDDHTQALAANAGSYSCADGSSAQNMTGAVPSDYRAHAPSIDAFNPTTGAAPDYFSIGASGGACVNDANLDLLMTSTTHPACYVLNMVTDKNGGQSCSTDNSGHCSITNGSGSYGDGSTIYVWVSKNPSCAAAGTPDDGAFRVTGHL